jgi:hypothetical protein
MTSKWCITIKNSLGWSAVVFCVCELTRLFCVVFCVGGSFDFRLLLKETPNTVTGEPLAVKCHVISSTHRYCHNTVHTDEDFARQIYSNNMTHYKIKADTWRKLKHTDIFIRRDIYTVPWGTHHIIPIRRLDSVYVCMYVYIYTWYRVSQEERTIFWEVIVSVILSKNFTWTCVLFRKVSEIEPF